MCFQEVDQDIESVLNLQHFKVIFHSNAVWVWTRIYVDWEIGNRAQIPKSTCTHTFNTHLFLGRQLEFIFNVWQYVRMSGKNVHVQLWMKLKIQNHWQTLRGGNYSFLSKLWSYLPIGPQIMSVDLYVIKTESTLNQTVACLCDTVCWARS